MANKKFTDLTQLTTPASDDQLAIVDTSAASSKRITIADLFKTTGVIPYATLLSTIFSGQVTTYTNAGNAGGTNTWYYANIGGIKLFWGESASCATQAGNATYTVTLPSGFFTTLQSAIVSAADMTNVTSQYASIVSQSAASISVNLTATANSSTSKIMLLAIGT
jgi:hypothetical protein